MGPLVFLVVWGVVAGVRGSLLALFVVLVVGYIVVKRLHLAAAPPPSSGTTTAPVVDPPPTSAYEPYMEDKPDVADEADAAVERLSRLAAELRTPRGRPRHEVVDEAAEIYAQLSPHVREEIDRRHPDGWLASAPVAADPVPAPAATPTTAPVPTGPVPTGPATTAPVPTAPVPAAPVATAPIVAAPVPTTPVPAMAPVDALPGGDVRYSVLAPDELTGDPTTPPGAVTEGWYVTADRSRERWHNGASWTAHVRVRGSR